MIYVGFEQYVGVRGMRVSVDAQKEKELGRQNVVIKRYAHLWTNH